MELPGTLFKTNLEKIKKLSPKTISLYFRKMELSGSNIIIFFVFSPKKGFSYFEKRKQNFLIFISVSNFPRSKMLIFREMELSDPKNLRKYF